MKTGAAYPEYKASGVPWLGDVPAHWEVHRLKHIAHVQASNVNKKTEEGESPVLLCNYVDVYYHDRITSALDFMRATATAEEVRKFRLHSGDVCVTKDSEDWKDIAVPALVEEDIPNLLCGYHLAMVRPHAARTSGPFLARAFSARGINDQFCVEANGITRFGLGADALRNGRFPVPPLDEQRAIAEFLDRETGKLDALVQKKERVIELLQEKRTALISHAVTKGLNPAAPMKDSGIPWLGKVPKHWQVSRLKFRLRKIDQGWSPQCDNRPAQPGEWGVLKVGCMNSGIYDESENKALPSSVEPAPEYEIKVGDVLISRSNTVELVGAAGIVHQTQGRILLCDKLFRLVFDSKKLSPEYAARLLRSPAARRQIEAASSGASPSMKNISNGAIADLVLPFPPPAEQQAIMQWTDAEALKLDALIAKVRTGIERLQEYRSALISAAVTGKIDVRQAQPSASKVVKLPPAPFRRAVFAAEVIHQLHDEPTFGHVKCQKILHLAEHHLGLPDFESNYFRQAAGPYDNRMMRSVDSQLEHQKWFRAVQRGETWHYHAMANAGQHQKYFDQFWASHQDGLQQLLTLLRKLDTERCEILSTLYAVWNDFLLAGASFDDAKLADEAIRWHPAKQRIERDRWFKALGWMREKGLVPRGTGKPTKVKK